LALTTDRVSKNLVIAKDHPRDGLLTQQRIRLRDWAGFSNAG
jgi:hypothetical protein